MLAAFIVHIHAAFSLDRRNRRASGTTQVSQTKDLAATDASRTMLWSVFHLSDLTWGTTRSLGVSTPLLNEAGKRRLAATIALAIGIGYASILLAVLTGILDYQ